MVKDILNAMGGKENIASVINCMTRLRFSVINEDLVDENKLNSLEKVLGTIHDVKNKYEVVVGPGNSRKYADELHQMGIPAAEIHANKDASRFDYQDNKKAIKASLKQTKIRKFLKIFGEIFVPLIPGSISAGLCAGFAMLIAQVVPNYAEQSSWKFLYDMLMLINKSFMAYITAWVGYRAAERFGATPILGGMLGMMNSMETVNTISKTLGLFNEAVPLDSILCAGRGGVLATIVGVFLLSRIEKQIRKRMPNSMDIICTPILSLGICLVLYLLVLMPAIGYVSSGISWAMGQICTSDILIVRILAGYLGAALFLPLVAAGMHHGLIALYTVQLEQFGYVMLYPALAMAGAGQVGASIALWLKAKRVGNTNLINTIKGAVPAGILGVGEPLIYGVTLPLGKPFLTAGLGAGFGGAFVTLYQVAATTWGASGITGIFVMTGGPNGAVPGMLHYAIGLTISYIAGGIITYFFIKDENLRPTDSQ